MSKSCNNIILVFFIPEKKLFYVGKDRKQDRLVVVSEEEKKKVLRECHENDSGAHHGISRTLTLVESSYYWTSVTNDVKQWVWLMSLEYLNNVFTVYIQNSLLLQINSRYDFSLSTFCLSLLIKYFLYG